MIDQLRSIAVFTTVAEVGSFRAAARRLALSPSVISHHVSALEAEFGLALFYRNTRKLALTEPGYRLLEHGRTIILAAEAGLDAVRERSENVSGTLKLTAPAILQEGPFVADIARFMEKYQKIRLEIQFTDKWMNLLDNRLDLALRIGKLEDSTMKTRRIIGGTQILCASAHYLSKNNAIAKPNDLLAHQLIRYPDMPLEMNLKAGSAKEPIVLPTRLTVDTGHSARSFAMQGQGIALLPHFFVKPMLDSGALVKILPGWELPEFDIFALWPANAGTRSLTKLFVDFLLGELSANPPLGRTAQT